jgi:hypothetical protein
MFRVEGPTTNVFNLSALKHVRSEKDPYSLMRMVRVNILNTIRTIDLAAASGAVSTSAFPPTRRLPGEHDGRL